MQPISIIIPTLNEERFLPLLLRSLMSAADGREMEIIVVDCRSEDRTIDVVHQYQNRMPSMVSLKEIQSPRRNISFQRNLGAHTSSHELLLFLDADIQIPSRNVFSEFVNGFTASGCVAASCRFLPTRPDWRGSLYYTILYYFQRCMQSRNPYCLGACLITTKKTFAAIGGFDPRLEIAEDVNFCQRALKFGRFAIFPLAIQLSTRRCEKYGYTVMGIRYIMLLLYRTFFGEYAGRPSWYEFGRFHLL